MRNYFEISDSSGDKKVNKNELTEFLDSINLKLKKDQLKALIKVLNISFIENFLLFNFEIVNRKRTQIMMASLMNKNSKYSFINCMRDVT